MRHKQLNNSQSNSKGFTLVELIAVVAIISMIAVYITIEINQSSDDAKIGLATAFLTSNVPGAISSFRARHMSSCRAIDDGGTIGGETYTEADDATKANLVARGLAANTPWDDDWTAAFDDDERNITITFPVSGTNAFSVAQDLVTNIDGRSQVVSIENDVTDGATAGNVTIVYSCS